MPDPSVAEAARYRRSLEVLWRRVLDDVVLLPPGIDEPVLISGPGGLVWELLSDPVSIDEIVDQVVAVYRAVPDRVRSDMTVLLDELVRLGAVRASP